MCLSTVYNQKNEKLAGNVAAVRAENGRVIFTDILGISAAVEGTIDSIDLMENLIYNELRLRGYSVDVGEVLQNYKDKEGNSRRKNLEVDFVCNRGFNRYYIQSAYTIPSPEKMKQELNSLRSINDEFKKIVIVGGMEPTYKNEDGILILNVFDFLLNPEDSLKI